MKEAIDFKGNKISIGDKIFFIGSTVLGDLLEGEGEVTAITSRDFMSSKLYTIGIDVNGSVFHVMSENSLSCSDSDEWKNHKAKLKKFIEGIQNGN